MLAKHQKAIAIIAQDSFLTWQKLIAASALSSYDYDQKPYYIGLHYLNWYIQDAQDKVRLLTLHSPPGSGKTDCFTLSTLAYLMQRHSNRKSLVVSATANTLRDFVGRINNILQCPANRLVFPNTNYIIKNMQNPEIHFSNGAIIVFKTTGSSVSIGMRYHYVFLDDAMSWDMMNSEVKNVRAVNQIKSTTTRQTFDPKTKFFVFNQILGFNDLSCFLKNSFQEGNIPYITLRFQDRYDEGVSYMLLNGKYINFEKGEFLVKHYNESFLNTQYALFGNDPARIQNEYKNKPTSAVHQIFNLDYLQYYEMQNLDNIIKKCVSFGAVADFAYTDKSSSDYTAFLMFGCDIDGNLYVLDIQRFRKPDIQAANEVRSLYCMWRSKVKPVFNLYIEAISVNTFIFREYEQQIEGDIDILYFGMPRSAGTEYLKGGALSKAERARNVMPRYTRQKLIIPLDHKMTNALKNEMYSFTSNNMHLHDDMVDCIIDALKYIHP